MTTKREQNIQTTKEISEYVLKAANNAEHFSRTVLKDASSARLARYADSSDLHRMLRGTILSSVNTIGSLLLYAGANMDFEELMNDLVGRLTQEMTATRARRLGASTIANVWNGPVASQGPDAASAADVEPEIGRPPSESSEPSACPYESEKDFMSRTCGNDPDYQEFMNSGSIDSKLYKKLLLKYHPDKMRQPGLEECTGSLRGACFRQMDDKRRA